MSVTEVRDAEEARQVLAQGYLMQRLQAPRTQGLTLVLEWALELANAGVPIPPLGVLADLGHLLLDPHASPRRADVKVPGWTEQRALAYEDFVLGKWLADSSLERAGDAVRQYQGPERVRGLAFVFTQIRARAGFGGILMNPAAIKKHRDQPGEQFLSAGWDLLERAGLHAALLGAFDDLERQVRRATLLLGPEDLFELEHRTALADFSQRVALRQVLQAAATLREAIPERPPMSSSPRREVPSHLRDENAYPIGGFTSLSNRGSIESLLHSQLAYMDDDRPDLFDIKFLRDELLYYSRDENQFFRRRRTFVLAFHPDLVQARVKDPASAWQRIVLTLAMAIAMVRRLLDWLGGDALFFDLVFLQRGQEASPLEAEQHLVELVLREQIANKTVRILTLPMDQLSPHGEKHARRSLVDCVVFSHHAMALEADAFRIANFALETLDLSGPPLTPWTDGLGRLMEGLIAD